VDRGVDSPEDAALVFSGPRLYFALIAGVVLAFAIQCWTNLSVAAGISTWGVNPTASDNDESGSVGGTIRKIGTAVGIWTLVTVSIALFIACLLAVQLSLIDNAGLGAIVGLVIWGPTCAACLGEFDDSGFLSWLGREHGLPAFKQLWVQPLPLGANAAKNQVVKTAEAADAMGTRLGSAVDPTSPGEH